MRRVHNRKFFLSYYKGSYNPPLLQLQDYISMIIDPSGDEEHRIVIPAVNNGKVSFPSPSYPGIYRFKLYMEGKSSASKRVIFPTN
jgi:hypothetical protein